MRKKATLALVSIAFFNMAAKGESCTTTVEPISGPGEEAGTQVVDSGVHADATTTGKDGAPSNTCVEAPALAASDLSCNSDQDCTSVWSGTVCSCECACPTVAANTAAYSRLQSALGSVLGASGCSDVPCECPAAGVAHCFAHQCALCGFSGSTVPNQPAACDEDGGRSPINHRPSAAQCSTPAPAGDCAGPGPGGGGCTRDSDCTAGTNGRCLSPGGGPAAGCACTYDTCAQDTDCPGGQTCACHGSPYTDGAGSSCVQGNCRVDADCGAGGYCSPSSLTATCGDSLAGYYCHTAGDLCVDDSDCSPTPGSPDAPGCLYSTKDSRWECAQLPVCN